MSPPALRRATRTSAKSRTGLTTRLVAGTNTQRAAGILGQARAGLDPTGKDLLGSSGLQVADELIKVGRQVLVSTEFSDLLGVECGLSCSNWLLNVPRRSSFPVPWAGSGPDLLRGKAGSAAADAWLAGRSSPRRAPGEERIFNCPVSGRHRRVREVQAPRDLPPVRRCRLRPGSPPSARA